MHAQVADHVTGGNYAVETAQCECHQATADVVAARTIRSSAGRAGDASDFYNTLPAVETKKNPASRGFLHQQLKN
jgi:hypothetical protein